MALKALFHNVSRKSVNHQPSGLSILLHGVISLPDVTSYDKGLYKVHTHVIAKLGAVNPLYTGNP